ncbi:zinc finger CCCH domain-containing protein 17-like isoform X1 [Punica granatum]|uniref:Zinc finger CCCH domain-containing protein 17-like isoform X1 n=1 Tax=Punica granatum TaxID=22663 RepID=A0A6P8CES4_PUNGR|nr:zinc finger CCCH domain-containing protein 17-like isoform X1 [Punica granatum]
MDEEEMLKRNTDCVFFLASPLTCKKVTLENGVECEYRHSEIARLNPRDCWYWLTGNCLNLACGFRHPPLDLGNDAKAESTVLLHQSSATVKKTNVPCYFYYSGFCSKGEGCSFFHAPDLFAPSTAKSLTDSSAVTKRPLSKDVAIARKTIRSNPTERKLNLSRTFPKAAAQPQPAAGLPQIPVTKNEVAPVEGSGSLLAAGLTLQRSRISPNQSLEERFATEEKWKASPGSQVFADGNNSENLYYEDYQEGYSPPYVQHEEELNSPPLDYEFEEPSEYDPMNPHTDIFRECGMYDSWSGSKLARTRDITVTVQDELSRRVPDFLSSSERNLLHMELEIGDCPSVFDLRDCLRRRRGSEDCPASWFLRRHKSSRSNGYKRSGLGRNGFSQRLHKRLTALVGKSSVESLRNYGYSFTGVRKREALRRARVQNFWKHKGKRQLNATRAIRNSFSRGHRSRREDSATFAGPKTLDQIREECMRAEVNGEDSAGCSKINSSVDFQSPKPLSELLKNKAG